MKLKLPSLYGSLDPASLVSSIKSDSVAAVKTVLPDISQYCKQ